MMRSRSGAVLEWIGLILFLAACLVGYVALEGDEKSRPVDKALARPYLVPDRIHVSVDEAEPARLQTVFSGGFGTLARDVNDSFVEAPALLVSARPIQDYQGNFDRAIQEALVPGQMVAVIASGTGVGTLHELPVIEIFAGADTTLSERLIEEGYAVPRAELLNEHMRREHLIAALRRARSARAGYWAEADASGSSAGLGGALDEATAPPQRPAAWFRRLAFATIIVIALLLAWREAHWRKVERENPTWKNRMPGVAARIAGAFFTAGYLNLILRPGFGRELPPPKQRPVGDDPPAKPPETNEGGSEMQPGKTI